jgi:hypothetical protein
MNAPRIVALMRTHGKRRQRARETCNRTNDLQRETTMTIPAPDPRPNKEPFPHPEPPPTNPGEVPTTIIELPPSQPAPGAPVDPPLQS